jgi:hypothetical protein
MRWRATQKLLILGCAFGSCAKLSVNARRIASRVEGSDFVFCLYFKCKPIIQSYFITRLLLQGFLMSYSLNPYTPRRTVSYDDLVGEFEAARIAAENNTASQASAPPPPSDMSSICSPRSRSFDDLPLPGLNDAAYRPAPRNPDLEPLAAALSRAAAGITDKGMSIKPNDQGRRGHQVGKLAGRPGAVMSARERALREKSEKIQLALYRQERAAEREWQLSQENPVPLEDADQASEPNAGPSQDLASPHSDTYGGADAATGGQADRAEPRSNSVRTATAKPTETDHVSLPMGHAQPDRVVPEFPNYHEN